VKTRTCSVLHTKYTHAGWTLFSRRFKNYL